MRNSISIIALVATSLTSTSFAEPEEVATAQNVATTAEAKSSVDKCKITEAERQKCRDIKKSPEEELSCNAFLRGSEWYCRGKYEEALAEFKVAYHTKKIPAMLFNIAKCYDRLGEWVSALETYREYVKSDDDGPKSSKGEAVIRLKELELKLEEDKKPPPNESPKPSPSTPPPQKQGFVPSLKLTLPLAAGAVVAGGISAVLYGLASAKLGEVNDACTRGVPCQQRDSARGMAYTSYALFGVSVAAAAVSLAFGVWQGVAKKSGKKNLASWGFVPSPSEFSAGVGGEF